jgi:hypothetical protein
MVIRRRVLVYEAYGCTRRRLADLITYRVAFACKDEPVKIACHRMDNYIADILVCEVDNTFNGCYVDKWKLFLTGENNFRHNIAKTAPYKGNRSAKPEHLPYLRMHLIEQWGANVSDGEEADDVIAIEATAALNKSIIVSVDKDFKQVQGWHYNFVKKEGYYVTEEEGLESLYMQILTGDDADNIKGLYRVGPAKAAKILEESVDEVDMYLRCIDAYDGNEERVIENARLLYLRRHKDEIWQPPVNR